MAGPGHLGTAASGSVGPCAPQTAGGTGWGKGVRVGFPGSASQEVPQETSAACISKTNTRELQMVPDKGILPGHTLRHTSSGVADLGLDRNCTGAGDTAPLPSQPGPGTGAFPPGLRHKSFTFSVAHTELGATVFRDLGSGRDRNQQLSMLRGPSWLARPLQFAKWLPVV